MLAAVEDSRTKVIRNDSDSSLCINQTLTSPIKGWLLVLGKLQICGLSSHCLLAGPESGQPLHLGLVRASCQEALFGPLEMCVEYEVTE